MNVSETVHSPSRRYVLHVTDTEMPRGLGPENSPTRNSVEKRPSHLFTKIQTRNGSFVDSSLGGRASKDQPLGVGLVKWREPGSKEYIFYSNYYDGWRISMVILSVSILFRVPDRT